MMWDKIDFNAALEDCKRVRDGIKSDEDFQNADSGIVMYYLNTIIQAFESATIVKRGRCIPFMPDCRGYTEEFECSLCKNMTYLHYCEKDCDYEYCPHCGKKMN